MKKKFVKAFVSVIGLAVVAGVLSLTGCGNRDLFDTNHTYDRAIIGFPNGESLEVNVKQWCDYEGEQIQIISEDGTIYLVSSYNCILIRDKE